MIQAVTLQSHSPRQTLALGEWLGRRLANGDRLALCGGLGVGKTLLTRGIGRGLGVEQCVNSPTYVLIKSYTGRLNLQHCDWYRLDNAGDVESSGFADAQREQGVLVVEWADKFPGELEQPYLRIEFSTEGLATQPGTEQRRRIRLELIGASPALENLLQQLAELEPAPIQS